MPVIPAFRRLKEEDCKFQVSLGYIARPPLNFSLPSKKKKSVLQVTHCAEHFTLDHLM
jgi:hypothetical protein